MAGKNVLPTAMTNDHQIDITIHCLEKYNNIVRIGTYTR